MTKNIQSKHYEHYQRQTYGKSLITNWKNFLKSETFFFQRIYMSNDIICDLTINDFKLTRTIGRGAFGRVLLARRNSTSKYYAIKVLEREKVFFKNQIQHTLNEKKLLQSIRFPFTVHMEYFFKDNSYLYFVMPYIEGAEIYQLLKNIVRFEENVARFYISQVVLTLEYLHHLGIVYRDLKPENLLIDLQGYIKFTDFGFSKPIDKRTYTFCGTIDYLAPEIIRNTGYGKAVDWWATGILTFELCSGNSPFKRENTTKTLESIVNCHFSIPTYFTKELMDFVKSLLSRELSSRLGNLKNGAGDVKSHIWLQSTNWLALLNKSITAPFLPHNYLYQEQINSYTESDLIIASTEVYPEEFQMF